jgi:hypothetical protein
MFSCSFQARKPTTNLRTNERTVGDTSIDFESRQEQEQEQEQEQTNPNQIPGHGKKRVASGFTLRAMQSVVLVVV